LPTKVRSTPISGSERAQLWNVSTLQVTVFDRGVDLMNPEGLPRQAHLPTDKIASLGDMLINNSALSKREWFAFESARAVLRPGGVLLRTIQENPLVTPWREGTGQ
jgi:hypothetical protein